MPTPVLRCLQQRLYPLDDNLDEGVTLPWAQLHLIVALLWVIYRRSGGGGWGWGLASHLSAFGEK